MKECQIFAKMQHLFPIPLCSIAAGELDGLYRVYLKDPKTGYKLGRLVALTKKQEQILRAIDKSLLKECSE